MKVEVTWADNWPTTARSRQCSLLLTKQSFHHLRTMTGTAAVVVVVVAGQSAVVALATVDAETVHTYDTLINVKPSLTLGRLLPHREVVSIDLPAVTGIEGLYKNFSSWLSSKHWVGCVVQWQNVGLWPANFPCPALDLQMTAGHLCG